MPTYVLVCPTYTCKPLQKFKASSDEAAVKRKEKLKLGGEVYRKVPDHLPIKKK